MKKKKKKVLEKAQDALDWLKKNPNAENWKVKDKIENLKNETQPLIEKAEAKKVFLDKIEELKILANDLPKTEKNDFTNNLKEFEKSFGKRFISRRN